LIRLRRRHRSLDRIAFLLWLAGFDLDRAVIRRAVDRELVRMKRVFLGRNWNSSMRADALSRAAVKAFERECFQQNREAEPRRAALVGEQL
jgi:hypothetical protein